MVQHLCWKKQKEIMPYPQGNTQSEQNHLSQTFSTYQVNRWKYKLWLSTAQYWTKVILSSSGLNSVWSWLTVQAENSLVPAPYNPLQTNRQTSRINDTGETGKTTAARFRAAHTEQPNCGQETAVNSPPRHYQSFNLSLSLTQGFPRFYTRHFPGLYQDIMSEDGVRQTKWTNRND